MLKKIEEAIERTTGGDPETEQKLYPSTNYMAWAVLKCVEDLGMLPPTTNYYNTVLTPPTVTPTGELDYSFHRGWEEE